MSSTDSRPPVGRSAPAPTDRLRHVAHLGVRTRGFSYAVRGREAPEGDVRVELTAPSGAAWTWGDRRRTTASPAPPLDFCLVVTQRRHVADTDLVITGPLATEWMEIAQCFAGGPGTGRPRIDVPRPASRVPGAVGAQAAERHRRLVDLCTFEVGLQARLRADDAVHVDDPAAPPAHEMVVPAVVDLVHGPVRAELDRCHHAHPGQVVQDVVDGHAGDVDASLADRVHHF